VCCQRGLRHTASEDHDKPETWATLQPVILAAMRSEWSSTAGIVAYVVAAAVIAGGLLSLRPWRRHREREVFLAQLARCRDAWGRYRVYAEYLQAFTQRGQTKEDLDKWVAVAERRTGHHPWHTELTTADQRAV
jgi:hypothetical protein